jgi:TM2 domain-containing membrane protein YozV
MLNLEALGWLLTYLVIAIAIFLLIRQLVLWYFRVNEIADNIAYIADHYRHVDQEAGRQRVQATQQRSSSASSLPTPIGNRPTRE